MKQIKIKLEKSFKTPFNYTFEANLPYQAEIDGNGTIDVAIWNNDGDGDGKLVIAHFVKGYNIVIL